MYTVCYKDEAAALTDSDGEVSDADEENDVSVTTGNIILAYLAVIVPVVLVIIAIIVIIVLLVKRKKR